MSVGQKIFTRDSVPLITRSPAGRIADKHGVASLFYSAVLPPQLLPAPAVHT